MPEDNPNSDKPNRARRGRGEGSIRFREDKGLWAAELSLGYDGNGKRIRKTVYGSTKKEVGEELRKLQSEHDAGRLVETEKITTGEYLTRWLNNTAKNKVGVLTWERYRQLVELYLVPLLGGLSLAKLRAFHVEQAYATMEKGFGERKPAGPATRKFAGVVLGVALRHAVKVKAIPFNPAADVAKAKPAEREMQYMTGAQVKRFLAAAKGQGLCPLFAVAVGTGMRQGELLGLQWGDIDFEKGTVEVKRSLAWVKKDGVKQPVLKEPKSKAGKRIVGLPPFALTALVELRAEALKAALITAPVFCTRTGNYLDKKNVLRSFKNVVKKANKVEAERAAKAQTHPDLIPASVRFHDLRHTHATGLIAANNSIKAVSRRLGHGSIEITLRVYAHLMPNDDEKLTTGAEALFG